MGRGAPRAAFSLTSGAEFLLFTDSFLFIQCFYIAGVCMYTCVCIDIQICIIHTYMCVQSAPYLSKKIDFTEHITGVGDKDG